MNPAAIAHLFASADVSVDFDLTFLVQFVLFTTFVLVLKPLLFDPLMRVFEERERRTEGAKLQAREMDAEAGELITKYETELEKVRREAGAERDRLRLETAKLEAQIMAEARAEIDGLRAEVERLTPALSGQIAARILGREVQS